MTAGTDSHILVARAMLYRVRHSHFWTLMDEEFGAAYARTLARDLVVDGLGDRTAEQALAAGEAPRPVWEAVCEAMQVPVERRWGKPERARRSSGRRP